MPSGGQNWVEDYPPPSNLRIDGHPESDDFPTKSTGRVEICVNLHQALSYDSRKTRVRIDYSLDDFVTINTVRGPWYQYIGDSWMVDNTCIVLTGLRQDSRYRLRVYSEKPNGRSRKFNAASFWTNRAPTPPVQVSPAENQQFLVSVGVALSWEFSDPDPGDIQQTYEVQYRTAADAVTPAGEWTSVVVTTNQSSSMIPANTLKANRHYEWRVRVQDGQFRWSDWSLLRSFFVLGGTTPPTPLRPINDEAIYTDTQVALTWRFRDPDPGDSQAKADIRYRVVGTTDWFVVAGDAVDSPGPNQFFYLPPDTFANGFNYEWQVRTYDTGSGGSVASDWSASATFWGVVTPGVAVEAAPTISDVQGALGCGTHRVFVYAQGGQRIIGEIKPLTRIMWSRKRDDIANAIIDTNGFDDDCGVLLGDLRTWMHELVIFRDGVRVFEGPITRITYTRDNVEVEAKDVMAYVYRRIMRQGYDDSFHLTSATGIPIYTYEAGALQLGLTTVVKRAARILINALAPHDPNVLPYLTVLTHDTDARQSRIMPDYCKTAWEEIDDLASNAGLDYATVGRRIILWDTHNPIGKLPEMRDGDFSDPVIVTEYGMNLANYFAVTNGNGVWGAATPLGLTDPFIYYGPIEQLASAYGETEESFDPAEMTAEALAKMRQSMSEQAQRNISNRWPGPIVVRVPDNSSLNPEVNLGINQLVPGVWIPLRAEATCRTVAQWQKLDQLTVEETGGVEQVRVIMSPAPNGGDDDPDATGAEADE